MKKVCPFLMTAKVLEGSGKKVEDTRCIGKECALWRTKGHNAEQGWCGLGGECGHQDLF